MLAVFHVETAVGPQVPTIGGRGCGIDENGTQYPPPPPSRFSPHRGWGGRPELR